MGSLKAYMNEMDRELAQTNVGKSFTTQKRGVSMPGAQVCSRNFQPGNVLEVAILSNGIRTFPHASTVCCTCTITHFLQMKAYLSFELARLFQDLVSFL